MHRYRNNLPQLSGGMYVTDGGLETTLLFHDGFDLRDLAAFELLETDAGRGALCRYFAEYATIAREHGVGCVLEAPTWRASSRWGARLGYAPDDVARINHDAIEFMTAIRDVHGDPSTAWPISGNVGPRGDGYDPGAGIAAAEAQDYHAHQIRVFAATDADMVTAMTITQASEAIGIVRAASEAAMPVVISFTVETNGRLPTGQPLGSAIEEVDAATGGHAAYFMINCAHPTHFHKTLVKGAAWTRRVRGLRANASCKSHAELDEADELDAGNAAQLAGEYRALRSILGHINVLGGCCGTDHRHVAAIAEACMPQPQVTA